MDAPEFGPSAHAARTPDKAAFIENGLITTFVDFDARTDLIARGLAARGVGVADRVAIMLPNSVAFFEVWAAVSKLQGSVVLVNTHLKPDEVAYIVEDSQAKVLVDDLDLVDALIEAGADATVDLAPCEVLAAPVFYTSGTTGRPKGVVHGAFDGVAGAAGAAGSGRALGLAARGRVPALRPGVPRRAGRLRDVGAVRRRDHGHPARGGTRGSGSGSSTRTA